MNRFIEVGLTFVLLYITLTHFTTAATYEDTGLTNYKKLTNALQKRSGGILNHALSLNPRHFLTSNLHKRRMVLEPPENEFTGTDDDANKRRGAWYYDYGLGGGRFGKRSYDEYGLGGGRFGRDVDHVDLADA